MNLISEENKKLLSQLRDLIEFGNKMIDNEAEWDLNNFSPKQFHLFSTFGAVNNYSEAIYMLCKDARSEAAIVLLRSLLEAFITTAYVIETNSDKRVMMFLIDGNDRKRGWAEEMLKFVKRYPRFLNKNPLTSPAVLLKLQKRLEKENEIVKRKYKIKNKLPSLEERARVVDKRKNKKGDTEYSYQLVYRFFSPYAHLDANGINAFFEPRPEGGYTLIAGQSSDIINPHIKTLYAFYLYFLETLKRRGLIKNKVSFAPYRKIFKGFSKK